MRFIRSRSKCEQCPLRDRTRVWGDGLEGASLVFLGEAPGRDEDVQGRPFVGAAGRTLNWGFWQAGIHRDGVWIANFLSCRPPDNNFDCAEALTARANCRGGFEEELQFLRAAGMKVLVPLGGNACKMLGLSEPIGKIRGSVYEQDGLVVIPTYHPAFLARQRFASPRGQVDMSMVWIADLKKAKYIAQHGWKAPRESFELYPTIERLEEFVGYATEKKSLIAVDIETTSFDPGRGEIVVVGLADSAEHCVSVPFISRGGAAYWSNGDLARARAALDRLFLACPLLFQNALFDVPYLRAKGFRVEYENVQHDTLLLHHAVSPELPHNLGFIVSVYGSTPYWKGDVLGRLGSILELDDTTLRTYNARDCVVLHQVLGPLLADLEDAGTASIYHEEALPLLRPVGAMHERGILLDERKLSHYRNELRKKLQDTDRTLRLAAQLPLGFNLDSPDDLRWFLFGVTPRKFSKLAELEPRIDPKSGKTKTLRTDTKKYAELVALKAVRDDIVPIYRARGFRGRTTETGLLSTDDQGLLSLQLHVQNRAAEIGRLVKPTAEHAAEKEAILRLLSWLKDFHEYRRLGKLLSTYTNYPTWEDGAVHTRFSLSGTATARLSSSAPNLQNIPKKDVEARAPFVPRVGFAFLAADYVNLEVWIYALEARDEVLLGQLRAGLNVHDENTRTLFRVEPDHPTWKLARRAAKIFLFGHILYGGSEREIYEKVVLECPELALTFADFLSAAHRWKAAHPAYSVWARKVQHVALTERRVDIIGGRRRFVYGAERDVLKQALNTPIQGGAAYVVNRAMLRIERRLRGMRSGFVLQIHDEFLFEVAQEEMQLVQRIVREEMERPVDWRGEQVAFPSSQAVGDSWAACYVKED